MKGDRSNGDVQNVGDFFSSMAFGDQLENFSLPCSEAESGRGLGGIPKPLQVFAGKTRC